MNADCLSASKTPPFNSLTLCSEKKKEKKKFSFFFWPQLLSALCEREAEEFH